MKGPATPAGTDPNLGSRSSELQLGLHSDNVAFPEPFTPYAHACNVTWLLSDYTKDAGALALVPGSHKMCRHPRRGEGVEDAVAIEAPTGSLVVWHGNTWHGSYPRTVPGLRTGIAYGYTREYVVPHEPYYERVTKASLDRWPPRFATLMGKDTLRWDESGPDYTKLLQRPRRASLYW
jgi:ectoine hydroxylase-related dioxygenase (phytanoyl-CoA dioxygenase family)